MLVSPLSCPRAGFQTAVIRVWRSVLCSVPLSLAPEPLLLLPLLSQLLPLPAAVPVRRLCPERSCGDCAG